MATRMAVAAKWEPIWNKVQMLPPRIKQKVYDEYARLFQTMSSEFDNADALQIAYDKFAEPDWGGATIYDETMLAIEIMEKL